MSDQTHEGQQGTQTVAEQRGSQSQQDHRSSQTEIQQFSYSAAFFDHDLDDDDLYDRAG